LSLLVALALALVYNTRFWAEVIRLRAPLDAGDLLFLVSVFVILVAGLYLLLTLLAWPWLHKAAIALLLVVSAIVGHFTSAYGALIDSTMIQNTFETDAGEAGELIDGTLIARVLLLGVAPALLVLFVRVRRRPFLRELRTGLVGLVVGAVALLAPVGALYPEYASFFPSNHQLGHMVTPINVLAGTGQYIRHARSASDGPVKPLGLDARVVRPSGPGRRPRVLVVVVGETARASEFSLNGYERSTNPVLETLPVISFSDVSACGTSTAVSIPCMFSVLGHRDYDDGVARGQEGLLDVLRHAGLSVLWRENNTGCKGACDRVEVQGPDAFRDGRFCEGDDCFDEALLTGLDDFVAGLNRDAVIVLHQEGSHGPAYYLRYPESFRRFLPECRESSLLDCTREEVVNAYDNTILYTDWVLGRVIELLRRHEPDVDAAMLYVSDHGESLGGGNVYLHGLPYAIAPEEQRKVPMIFWSSPRFDKSARLDRACLAEQRDRPLSHDAMFHSVLGAMSVETSLYRPELDLFAPCRGGGSATAEPADRRL